MSSIEYRGQTRPITRKGNGTGDGARRACGRLDQSRQGTLLRALRSWCAVATASLLGAAPMALAQTAVPVADNAQVSGSAALHGGLPRPRIGLVLSGGGARGLAHVGVLKVLEEMRVPIDLIAGTSMGAIVGGLYAAGMSADELERELLAVRWSEVFASRIDRPLLSVRRKEEDFEIPPLIELGFRDGELRAPQGAVSSRGLESLLRRYTQPVSHVARFDALPIPFRAVATDLETGQPVVLDRGDLAVALRSSMSVPGLFSPTELQGRILGDGGLVDNTPVAVARAMGAEVLIVVNIGTPLATRDSLGSAVGVTTQMINILTEQNVQRSLALLRPRDVLIAPPLTGLSSRDFARVKQFIELGIAEARARSDRLSKVALDAAAYTAWRAAHSAVLPEAQRLAFVRIVGTSATNPERLQEMLATRAGQAFDAAQAERDTQRLASGGDYTRADYHLLRSAEGTGLVFDLEDKPWGPNYLRAGIDLGTDFKGNSSFNLKISHNRHWLTRNGTEWRNRLQIGEVPTAFTELYHPLAWTASRANDWFVAAYAGLQRRRLLSFDAGSGALLAEFGRKQFQSGADIGQPWGEFGELRLGWSRSVLRTAPEIVSAGYTGPAQRVRWIEDAVRARVVVDQLDFAIFPQSGYRAEVEAWFGRRTGDVGGHFTRIEAQGQVVRSWGSHTVSLHGSLQMADQDGSIGVGRYSLGGFHQLSGYQTGQLTGNDALLLRATWYRRVSQAPVLTRGFFVGATLEAGNVWAQRSAIRIGHLRTGASLFIGADTGIGPLFLGLTYAPQGSAGLALFIGRP